MCHSFVIVQDVQLLFTVIIHIRHRDHLVGATEES